MKAKVYEEQESVWKGGHQHELARLFEDAKIRGFDAAPVWALDRLSREVLWPSSRLFADPGLSALRSSHTKRVGPKGWENLRIFSAIVRWVAKIESQRRSERTKAGLDRLRRTGKKLGRPKGALDKKPRKHRK